MAASLNPFSALNNPVGGNIPQPTPPGAGITAANYINASDHTLHRLILIELRVISQVLAAGLNVTDDLDALRNDPSIDPDLPNRSQ